jgi:hypothetical protein
MSKLVLKIQDGHIIESPFNGKITVVDDELMRGPFRMRPCREPEKKKTSFWIAIAETNPNSVFPNLFFLGFPRGPAPEGAFRKMSTEQGKEVTEGTVLKFGGKFIWEKGFWYQVESLYLVASITSTEMILYPM